MKKKSLSATIKKINCRKLIMPSIFIVFCSIILHTTSICDIFTLPVVSSPAEAAASYHNGDIYVNATLTDLYYSGVNRSDKHKLRACYYYCLYENNCYYVLISASSLGIDSTSPAPPQHIASYNCKAKLESNEGESDSLTQLVSKKLNWTPQALNLMTSKVLINQYRMSQGREYILAGLLGIMSLSAIIHLIVIIVSLINPLLSRTVLRLSSYGNRNELYNMACAEFEDSHVYAPGITLTDNFFIAYDKHNIHIVPLEAIVWAYKFGTLQNRLLHLDISYSLSVVANDKKHYIVHHKTKDAVELVLNALQTRFPEILIGYSEGKSMGTR